MKQIKAEIIADSKCPRGNRITTFVLIYPRIIHGELMTHRMFSRNAASSRAIPFEKMVKQIEENPFIPIAWQKDHIGMQGSEYFENQQEIDAKIGGWISASKNAIEGAKRLNSNLTKLTRGDASTSLHTFTNSTGVELKNTGVTKQLCNRLLEPFQWMTTLVTATEYDNFFELRCPQYDIGDGSIHKSKKNAIQHVQSKCINTELGEMFLSNLEWICASKSPAEIHIQALAESMWDARNESTPNELKVGEWHIPFGDKFDMNEITKVLDQTKESLEFTPLKIATARCARISYLNHDGDTDYEKDINLHDKLLESKHASAFEHCCIVPSEESYISSVKGNVAVDRIDDNYYSELIDLDITDIKHGWFDNFKGFQSYRNILNM